VHHAVRAEPERSLAPGVEPLGEHEGEISREHEERAEAGDERDASLEELAVLFGVEARASGGEGVEAEPPRNPGRHGG
jgi:hypothetical protein